MSRTTHHHTDALDTIVERFATLLAESGLRAGLGFLNARTRHRFTGVYRFDPPMLRNLGLFDRENPTLSLTCDTPMRETYCSLVGRDAVPFVTEDAGADERLLAHPVRAAVVAYCGVPIIGDDQTPFGSLCHFDHRPRLAHTSEIPLLERAAPLLLQFVARARQSA